MSHPEQQRRLRRARRRMSESAERLIPFLDDVRFPVEANDFLVYELDRIMREGEPSFDNEDFRFLIEQGIRLRVNPDLDLRAEIAERLRRGLPGMIPSLGRAAIDVIGAVEDAAFPLGEVGVVVRGFTRQLFSILEESAPSGDAEIRARTEIEQWRAGAIDGTTLRDRLRDLGEGALGPVSDWLCESIDDAVAYDAALEALDSLASTGTGRVLAYLISAPMLSEAQERRAFSMLRNRWPVPREYMLYRLREHTHEDIPYRWFELLVEAEETRAVDLILEELLVHGGIPEYREDLTAVLGLIEGSRDPGRIGKIVRLLSFESVSRERLGLLEEWLATSSLAGPVGEAVEARKAGRRVLVPRDQDLAAFVAHGGEAGGEDLWDEWREAYHESLGWQRHADFPQGPAREAFEQELRSTMVRSARLTRDEALLRDRIEAFEEEWLMNSHTGPPSLARIHRESPRNPWMDEVRNFDLNSWYIRAAQAFDEGRSDRARRYLDVLLGIDAGYPLATALDRVLNRQERDGESNVSGR